MTIQKWFVVSFGPPLCQFLGHRPTLRDLRIRPKRFARSPPVLAAASSEENQVISPGISPGGKHRLIFAAFCCRLQVSGKVWNNKMWQNYSKRQERQQGIACFSHHSYTAVFFFFANQQLHAVGQTLTVCVFAKSKKKFSTKTSQEIDIFMLLFHHCPHVLILFKILWSNKNNRWHLSVGLHVHPNTSVLYTIMI